MQRQHAAASGMTQFGQHPVLLLSGDLQYGRRTHSEASTVSRSVLQLSKYQRVPHCAILMTLGLVPCAATMSIEGFISCSFKTSVFLVGYEMLGPPPPSEWTVPPSGRQRNSR